MKETVTVNGKRHLQQIYKYDTIINLGYHTSAKIPQDGRHKSQLVADGHLTVVSLESLYSGVVSLRGFRHVMFMAELNNLNFWVADIGNAYLESLTAEKLHIIVGPEIGELEGHTLVIIIQRSGVRWNDSFSDYMSELLAY
jgi:hypothetical protein